MLAAVVLVLAAVTWAEPPPHLLEACDCNGKSTRCYFDQDLWERTGHGGHCIDCEENTAGPRCETCLPQYYRSKSSQCVPCACDHIGSVDRECSPSGQCRCKPGFGGLRCNRCAPNHYRVSPHSCLSCGCQEAGVSVTDSESCASPGGPCSCKENVEGHRCERCKSGYFDLQRDNDIGCVPCFCYGHSSECHSTPGWSKFSVDSTFSQGKEGWTATDYYHRQLPVSYDPDLEVLELRSPGRDSVYFNFPARYLGDQRASYNQYLGFTLRIGKDGARASAEDLILEGGGLKVSVPIVGQDNPLPVSRSQNYSFRLNEHTDLAWTPRLSSADFLRLLSNLTSIRLKGLYSPGGVGYLDNVQMGSAKQGFSGDPATWVETCKCPPGHAGPSCETCLLGYVRDIPDGGPFARCVRCNCHGHADSCDPATGRCECQHNTAGDHCDRCASGYYGNALQGTSTDCTPCPCPNRGPCVLLPGGKVACQQCPIGSTGHSCELCVDGYFGDPLGRFGPPHPCTRCQCSGNVDPNAVGNCNSTTGGCLKCIYNTAGLHCERCQTGFFGNALGSRKGECKPCDCHEPGTVLRESGTALCDLLSGQCSCRSQVGGRRCDSCMDGYWGLDSGQGCQPCDCDGTGSLDRSCDPRSGQCRCRAGVSGRRCDRCLAYFHGFSRHGCQACNCDPAGSVSLQCDDNGQCPCRPNMEGQHCNQCKENKYNRGVVCIDCPPCYSLVEETVDDYRERLSDLSRMLDDIRRRTLTPDDRDFRRRLQDVHIKIDDLLSDVQRAADTELGLWARFQEAMQRLNAVLHTAGQASIKTDEARVVVGRGTANISAAEDTVRQADAALTSALEFLAIQARDALAAARARSLRLGEHSDRLSAIAREARVLADGHENDVGEILAISLRALNTSMEAYQLARETVESGDRQGSEIYSLKKRTEELADWTARIAELAEKARTEAHATYEAALDVYTDTNSVTLPAVDVAGMRTDAEEIVLEARRIRAEAEGLEAQHAAILDKMGKVTKTASELLSAANKQQQKTDELLTETDAALKKAKDAVESGDKTLGEAKKTLATLQGFDQSVQDSKEQALEALRRIPTIEMLIEDAERKTGDAANALNDAERDALDARDIAQRAQRLAEQASKDADTIRKGADDTKTQAATLKTQAQKLSENVEETGERMRQYEAQAATESVLANEALERAHEGKTKAVDGIQKAKDAMASLDEILRALSRLEDLDSGLLDELRRRLVQADGELTRADLPNRAGLLRTARDQQRIWIADYEEELRRLQADVANVAAIRFSLPEGCYRRIRLEP